MNHTKVCCEIIRNYIESYEKYFSSDFSVFCLSPSLICVYRYRICVLTTSTDCHVESKRKTENLRHRREENEEN